MDELTVLLPPREDPETALDVGAPGELSADEAEPGWLDARGCAAVLTGSVLEQRRVVAAQMSAIAQWADIHNPELRAPRDQPDEDRGRLWRAPRHVRPGGQGTPVVLDTAVTELGVLLQTTTGTARHHLADCLDLRHRLPAVWAGIQDGTIDGWKGRKLAAATRHLTEAAAAHVDSEVVTALTGLPYARAWAAVEAAIITADPAAHEARRTAQRSPGVRVGRIDPVTGTRTLWATAPAAAVNRLLATVNHLADLHATHGDTAPAPERQTRALLDLGNPAATCLLLAQPQPDPEPPSASERASASEPEPPLPEPPPLEPGEPEHWTPIHHATAVGHALARALASLGLSKTLDRLRPRTVIHVHLAEEALPHLAGTMAGGCLPATPTPGHVARTEDAGPVSLSQLREWLSGERITVRPVAYPRSQASTDDYQLPRPLAEALILREPFEVFPYGTQSSRYADHDHTTPYRDRRGHEPRTGLHNLGPLSRTHHLAKTHHGFLLRQPLPGTYYWRTPTGYWYRVHRGGTRSLGDRTPPVITAMDHEHHLSHLEKHLQRTLADART